MQLIRTYMQNDYDSRCRRNPRYSLRAYASYLGIDASSLSKILKGTRPIGKRVAHKVSQKLGLPEMVFANSHHVEESYDFRAKELSIDQFRVLSDWHHFAILELIHTRGFRSDIKWIANRLSLQPLTVDLAVQRLQRMGFLKIDEQGRWYDESGTTTTGEPVDGEACFRKMQRDLLACAQRALEDLPSTHRDHSSLIVAANSRNLPTYKNAIKRFRRELLALMENEKEKDEVFHLTIALYPLSSEGGGIGTDSKNEP